MEVNIEELVAGLFFLAYVVYGPLVKGGFWKQNWTNKGWVTANLLGMHAHSFPSSWYCFDA